MALRVLLVACGLALVLGCDLACLNPCLQTGSSTTCFQTCGCVKADPLAFGGVVTTEDGRKFNVQKVPLSQDEQVEDQLGCNSECASMCSRSSHGQALLECITYCGCACFISEIPRDAVQNSIFEIFYTSNSDFPPTANLGRVWVSLRRIYPIFGSANHWAVIIEVFGHGFICVQFYTSIGISYHQTMRGAALASWGSYICDVRTSYYGYAYAGLTVGILTEYMAILERGRFNEYSLFFNNCQHFARAVVDYLTGKWVGWFPIENGPDFSP